MTEFKEFLYRLDEYIEKKVRCNYIYMKYLTKKDLAGYLRCSDSKVEKLKNNGEIGYYKNGRVLYDREEIDEYMRRFKIHSKYGDFQINHGD